MDSNLMSKKKQVTSKKDVKIVKNNKKAIGSDVMRFKKGNFKGKKKLKATGFIYLGRIPHGFYEDQMTAYFSQFGKILSAHVPRSKKSGRSKGYGFVEFEDEEVAKIAAETMNNYLMYNKVVKCRFIPNEERKNIPYMRKTLLTYPKVINRVNELKRRRESVKLLSQKAYHEKTLNKIKEFKNFFQERGIEFNFKVNTKSSKSSDFDKETSEKDGVNSSIAEDEMEDEMEDEFGVLEIDTSDTDIHFQIAPQVKKIIKKSSNLQQASVDSLKKNKFKTTKNLRVKNQIVAKPEEEVKKIARNSKEKTKRKEKPLGRLSKTEKGKVTKKKNESVKISKKKAERKPGVKAPVKSKKEQNSKKLKSAKPLTKKVSSGMSSGKNK